DVDDVGDLVAQRVQGTHGGFATRARTLDAHFQRLHAVIQRGASGLFGRDLRCERRGLARTAEARTARSRPRQRVALAVGDGDDGVVEGSLHVHDAVGDDALGFLLGLDRWCHVLWTLLSKSAATACAALVTSRATGPARKSLLDRTTRTFARARIGARTLTTHRQAAAMAQTAIRAESDLIGVAGSIPACMQIVFDRERPMP